MGIDCWATLFRRKSNFRVASPRQAMAAASRTNTEATMLGRNSISMLAIATALLASLSAVQAFDDAKYPDLAGQWGAIRQRVVGQPSFDPSKGWGLLQQAPLTAEYQKVLEASLADQN